MSVSATVPIRRRKLYEEVALRIEQMLAEGRFTPGDKLPSERVLMEEFGVGRSAVREALLTLQRMGLVAVSSGERARVLAPSADALVGELAGAARRLLSQPGGIERFQQARTLFEIGIARLAAQIADDDDLRRLEAALEANRASIGNHAQFQRTDVAFHYALAQIPQNSIFTSLHEALAAWLTEQRAISGLAAGAGEAAHQAHQRIFRAVAARDPAAAEAAMQEHLESVSALYWQVARSDHLSDSRTA